MKPEEYFANHTLNPDFLAKEFGITWDEKQIVIPIYNEKGERSFDRYRHLEGNVKFTSEKGSHPTLYPLHRIGKFKNLILCEGEPDCLRLWQEKIPAVTGTGGVTTFNSKLAEPLRDKNIFLVLDNDAAGQNEINKYIEVLTAVNATVKIIELPHEFKDVSEYFTAGHTKEDFTKLASNALDYDVWLERNEPETFALETAAEIVALDIPPEQWLVNRILPVEGFAFFVGAEATAKTFDALTIAHAVATGTPWLDTFEVPSKGRVLIIDKENTKRRIHSRMKGLGIDSPDIFRVSYPHYFEVNDPEQTSGFSLFAQSLSRKVKKLNIKLLIIDSFTDVLVGNENDRGDVQGFFDAMRQLFPGISIMVLHHASKPAQGVMRSKSQMARGSTNIMAQTYSAFHIEAVPKSKTEFILEQTKAGDSEKLNPFLTELFVLPDPEDPQGTVVAGINYRGEVITEDMKIAEAVSVIEEAFKVKNLIPRQELLDICQAEGISQRTALRAIKQLSENNKIDSIPDPANKSKRNYMWMAEIETEDYD